LEKRSIFSLKVSGVFNNEITIDVMSELKA